MLMAGTYPWALKQRIRSRTGHLSNDDAGAALMDIWNHQLHHVILAHLSKENNMPELAQLIAEQSITMAGGRDITTLHVARQDQPLPVIELPGHGFERSDE